MKQIYHHYQLWECYKNGMWISSNCDIKLKQAIEFTSDHIIYGNAMFEVINNWKYSCENFLSNKSINRKAYLGHCAVSFKLNIPECITRKAWKYLTKEQQDLANNEALINILKWEQKKELESISQIGRKNATNKEYQTKLLLN